MLLFAVCELYSNDLIKQKKHEMITASLKYSPFFPFLPFFPTLYPLFLQFQYFGFGHKKTIGILGKTREFRILLLIYCKKSHKEYILSEFWLFEFIIAVYDIIVINFSAVPTKSRRRKPEKKSIIKIQP